MPFLRAGWPESIYGVNEPLFKPQTFRHQATSDTTDLYEHQGSAATDDLKTNYLTVSHT